MLEDFDHHSDATLAYLKANASTKYTLAEFKSALAQEYVPQSITEANKEIIAKDGKYSTDLLASAISNYLVDTGATQTARKGPMLISL